jgi:glycosyltransferase involved in cell wall biosynthesis
MAAEVSVIIPTCNRAHLLPSALKSVLQQSLQNIEVIVVDDHSADDTLKVIEEFDDSRLRCVARKERGGGAVARNTGIAAARGKYIAFLDDDDTWISEKLSRQLEVFSGAPSVGLVYTGVRHINQQNGLTIKTAVPSKRGRLYRGLLADNFIGTTSSVMVRREALEHCGYFDPELPSCQDWDLYLRISSKYAIDFVSETMVNFYIHPFRITRDLGARIRGRERILKKYQQDIAGSRSLLSRHHTALGKLYCHSGSVSKGRSLLFKAVKENPLAVSAYKLLLPALFGGSLYRGLWKGKQQVVQCFSRKHRLDAERKSDNEQPS